MNYKTIADVYEANDRIREKLKTIVSELTEEQANFLPEGEKWHIASVMEHLATVEEGMTKISAKLLSKAETDGKTSDGTIRLSENFVESIKKADEEDQKFVAPERVHPQGQQTVAESLKKMETNREYLNNLRSKFEEIDGTEYAFPHPAFGNLTAQDWLALIGVHEIRHTNQIKRILSNQ